GGGGGGGRRGAGGEVGGAGGRGGGGGRGVAGRGGGGGARRGGGPPAANPLPDNTERETGSSQESCPMSSRREESPELSDGRSLSPRERSAGVGSGGRSSAHPREPSPGCAEGADPTQARSDGLAPIGRGLG